MIDTIFIITLTYIIAGLFMWLLMGAFIENPLWLGLTVMFWPVTLVLCIAGLPILGFVAWIKECKAYYEDKRDEIYKT